MFNARTAAYLTLVATAGCGEADTQVATQRQEVASVSPLPNKKLDLLFVIDNSGSMRPHQEQLVANFDGFIEQLRALPGGVPGLHLGVISTDVGVLAGPIGGCTEGGDDGRLLLGLTATTDGKPYLVSDASTNSFNYSGTLESAFASAALRGDKGCGFEQPLQAIRKALDSGNLYNDGFLREDANLSVVIISDEDDCSVKSADFFSGFEDIRCFSTGVICDDDSQDSLTPGVKTNCRPRENSPYQHDVKGYADWLVERKGDPRSIMVAGVIGPTDPSRVTLVPVERGGRMGTYLERTCEVPMPPDGNDAGGAIPAVRTSAFLDAFPGRDRRHAICESNYGSVLDRLGASARRLMNATCLDQEPRRTEAGAPDCIAVEVPTHATNGARVETPLVQCGTNAAGTDCYELVIDRQACATTPSGLKMTVNRATSASPAATHAVLRCATADSAQSL